MTGIVRRQRLADASDDFKRRFGLAQQKPAAAASQHFFDRAAEVDVDDVEARLDQPQSGRPELLGIGPHQLPADGVLFVA